MTILTEQLVKDIETNRFQDRTLKITGDFSEGYFLQLLDALLKNNSIKECDFSNLSLSENLLINIATKLSSSKIEKLILQNANVSDRTIPHLLGHLRNMTLDIRQNTYSDEVLRQQEPFINANNLRFATGGGVVAPHAEPAAPHVEPKEKTPPAGPKPFYPKKQPTQAGFRVPGPPHKTPGDNEPIVVYYYPEWSDWNFDKLKNMDPNVDWIMLSFVQPLNNNVTWSNAEARERDKMMGMFHEAVKMAHNKGQKILASIGGQHTQMTGSPLQIQLPLRERLLNLSINMI